MPGPKLGYTFYRHIRLVPTFLSLDEPSLAGSNEFILCEVILCEFILCEVIIQTHTGHIRLVITSLLAAWEMDFVGLLTVIVALCKNQHHGVQSKPIDIPPRLYCVRGWLFQSHNGYQ